MPKKRRSDPIQNALVLIETDYSQPLSIADIAEHVRLSPFHFQRLFAHDTGETVAGYIRRRRLEQAAKTLAANRTVSLIDLAMDCGFETHSAFSRAFKRHFDMTPSAFADGGADDMLRNSPGNRPFLKPLPQRDIAIQMDQLDLPDLWLQYRQQQGRINGVFFPNRSIISRDLAALAARKDDSMMALCGAYQAGPLSFTDPDAVGHYGAVFQTPPSPDWSPHISRIGAGTWAIIAHHGPFEKLHMTWNKACHNWLPANGLTMRKEWMFEIYLASPDTQDRTGLSAQIYLPIAKTAQTEQQAR